MISQKINRREFTKTALLGATAIAFAGISFSRDSNNSNDDQLCILHTNDTHSRIDPYPANDPNYPNMGGYARRAGLIQQIRETTQQVLLLDAGDIFQGTPYYNAYGGEPELKLMTQMQYDAATMGNHEFDNGLDGFIKVLPFAGFPFITSNYDFSQTPLRGKTLPYKIFRKGRFTVGVYGLGIELEGLVSRSLYGQTIYQDPISVAQKTERLLKEEMNCNLIVCLSHLGYQYDSPKVSDVVIAQNTRYTDIILGGHTHTILDPLVQKENLSKKNVFIGQTGYGGVNLGRINVQLHDKSSEFLVESNTIIFLNKQDT